jgi:hypothetical protein
MPDITQLFQDNKSDSKAPVKHLSPPPAQPQEIGTTKPSAFGGLFSSIPMPRILEPVEKCSPFDDLPAADYHLSVNSVAYLFAKNALISFELNETDDLAEYLRRAEKSMKELYPLFLPAFDILLENVGTTREQVAREKSNAQDEENLVNFENKLIERLQGLTSSKWEKETELVDGEDLNNKLIVRVVKALERFIAQRRRGGRGPAAIAASQDMADTMVVI